MDEKFYSLLKKLNLKFQDAQDNREEILFSIEKLLKDQIRVNRYNTEIWLRLAMLEYTPPLEDFDTIIYYLESILKYDPINVDALITMTYMYAFVYHFCEIPDDLLKKLQLLHCSNNEKASMIEIAKAWAYSTRDEEAYIQCLREAISLYPFFVEHYLKLGEHYIRIGKAVEGKSFIICGLKNVQLIYSPEIPKACVTDIEEFYNEQFRGTHMTQMTFIYYTNLL